MTIADLRARSRDMHRYIRLVSCSRLPSFYTYPRVRIHAIHDTFRARYIRSHEYRDSVSKGRKRETMNEREREREGVGEERMERTNERPGEIATVGEKGRRRYLQKSPFPYSRAESLPRQRDVRPLGNA